MAWRGKQTPFEQGISEAREKAEREKREVEILRRVRSRFETKYPLLFQGAKHENERVVKRYDTDSLYIEEQIDLCTTYCIADGKKMEISSTFLNTKSGPLAYIHVLIGSASASGYLDYEDGATLAKEIGRLYYEIGLAK